MVSESAALLPSEGEDRGRPAAPCFTNLRLLSSAQALRLDCVWASALRLSE